ncbi:MAG TPA: ribonuclease HI family protein [Myxococcaceae bacterium]|nr:ribonuclease HI family protein [Myxococcaceae bacterium]
MSGTRPSLPELLRVIAEEESLDRTLSRFPGLSRTDLVGVLLGRPAPSHPAPSRPPPSRATHLVQPHRKLRVTSDGAARGNPGLAGAGAVLYDEQGQVLERLGKFLGRQTNNVAEYQGLLLGLRRAQELGAEELEVVADSELMIRQLSGAYQVRAPALRELHSEALSLLKAFRKVKLVHVPRAQNADADEMSNRAIDERL